jgi:hypothetical protein
VLLVAHGTKILAMPPSPGRAAFALDTVTMAITAGPLPKANDQQYCCRSFLAVGDRLYIMDERETDYGPCNFNCQKKKLLNHFILLHLNTKTKAKAVKPDMKTNANLRNIENLKNEPI